MKVKHIGGNRDLEMFNEEFPKHKVVVAGFFADWCGHCKTFKPEWQKFAAEAEKSPLEALIATIPEEHMKGAKCDQTNFQGFPTVRIFKDSGFEDYKGKRDAKALMDHIKTVLTAQRGGGRRKKRGGVVTDAEVAASSADVGSVGPLVVAKAGKWTRAEWKKWMNKPLKVRIHHVDDTKLMTPIAVQEYPEGGWSIEFGMGEKENDEWARTSLYRPEKIKSFRLASTGLGGGGKKIRKGVRSTRKKTRRKRRRRRHRKGTDFDRELKRVIAQHRRFQIARGDKRFKATKGLVKWTRPGKTGRTKRIYYRKRRTRKRRTRKRRRRRRK